MATAAKAAIGHNMPPEPTPYEALKTHIDDLFDTAQSFLDGDPVNDAETAEMVSKLIDEARKARMAAEAQRKLEAKPFDDGKAAVQALWTPLTDEKKGRCALISDTAKRALAPWLTKLDNERQEAARIQREEADRAAALAREALKASSDLAAREQAEELLKYAAQAEKAAKRADNASANVSNDGRAIGLVSVWTATITDRKAALYHYLARDSDSFVALIQKLADQDVRAGSRAIPGITITEEKRVR